MRFDNKTEKTALAIALLIFALTAAFRGDRQDEPRLPSESEALPSAAPPAPNLQVRDSAKPMPEVPADIASTESLAATTVPVPHIPPSSVNESTKGSTPSSATAARPKAALSHGPPVVARAEGPADEPLLEPQLLPPPAESSDPTTPVVARYYDQLIDPTQPFDPTPPAGPVGGLSSRLPGSASVEYRLFDETTKFDPNQRHYTEQGVAVTAQQETRGFGRFELRGAQTDVPRSDGFNNFQGDSYFNLAQRDFALTDRWVMNNELGDIRVLSPVEVASGYRIRLPTPLVEGAVAEANSSDLSLRFSSGSLGTYRGRTFPVFSTNDASGRVNGVAGSYRIDPNWSAGAQVWQATGVATATGQRDFSTWAGGLRFDGHDAGKAQFNALYNDSGATGLWTDGERRFGAWQHNAGLFRLDPDLQWVDRNSAIQSDIEGTYWRATTRSFHSTISTGIDWSRSNIKNDPSVPRRTNTAGFAGMSYRATADTDLTGYLALGREQASGAGGDSENNTRSARGSVTRRFTLGSSVWALGVNDRSGSTGYSRYDAEWDHYWNRGVEFSGLRTGLAFTSQSGSSNDFSQGTVRMSGVWSRQPWSVSGSLSAGYYDSNIVQNGRTVAVGLSAGRTISRGWQAAADISYNRNALTLLADGSETRVTDWQFLLSLRYDTHWGTPEYPVGYANGNPGRGTVRGILFLDYNGNGVRDPEEPGVRGVLISLDRGYGTETNAAGEFTFSPVATGEHHLSVDVANVPLPWLPVSDRPVSIHVAPRETAIVEIPLRKELP
jgi:hypothetical protein